MKGLVSLILVFLVFVIAVLIGAIKRWLRQNKRPTIVEKKETTDILVPKDFFIPPSPPKPKYPIEIKWPIDEDKNETQ